MRAASAACVGCAVAGATAHASSTATASLTTIIVTGGSVRDMKRALLVVVVLGCKARHEPAIREGSSAPPVASGKHDAIARVDFNRFAVRQNLPVFWVADKNNDKSIDPAETAALLFYPTTGQWVANGAFTKDFEDAYARIVAAAKAP